jgi:DNA polymerase I-like protein with 3'-5' exonuclease and polymerase domains
VSDRGIPCLNMVPYQLTDKGEPSLTAEVLERMVNDSIPHARAYYEWTKVDNAASMWYEGYAEKMGTDGRLRCAFRQNGTVSSRFSVERINLQAIPQDYRLTGYDILRGIPTPRQLIAQAVDLMEGGWRLFELDLAQAELRVAAVFAKCQSMLDLIFAGADLHTVTTRELFDMDTDHPEWGKYRQVGKRGNFSLIFGSQWLTFQKMVSKETGILLPDHESQRIVLEWNRLYPEFGRAIQKHANKVAVRQARHGHGWIDLRNGERRWFQKYEETHKAFNQRVQPNLAQFGIDWMLQTDEFLRKEGYGEWNQAGLVLTIHDSQVLLLPDDKEGEQLAEACAQFGRDLWGKWFPEVPGEVDYHPWEVAA